MRKAYTTILFLFIVFNSLGQKISPAGPISICAGQNQVLTVTGGAPVSYQWQRDGTDAGTSSSYTVTASGSYRVIINGGHKAGDTLAPVNVTVNPPPVASFSFTPASQCSNVPVNFTNSSVGGVSYLWDFGDANSGNNNTSTAQNPSHTFIGTPGNSMQSFTVKLVTKTAAGCADSITHIVTTKQIPDGTLGGTGKGTFQGNNYFTICGDFVSGDFTFSNQSKTGSTNTNYRIVWGDGSSDFTPGTVFNKTVEHTYVVGTHKLLFIITGQNGCVDTTNYSVFVGTNPAVGLANPGNTAICAGKALDFPITETASNAPGTIYRITFNDGSVPEVYIHPNVPTSVSHTFQLTSCGTRSSNGTNSYNNSFSASIIAENPCNSSAASIVPIYVSEKPKASFEMSPKDTICLSNLLTLTNTSKSSSVNNGTCVNGNIIWSVSPATGWTINSGSLGNDFSSSNPSVWQTGSDQLGLRFTQPGVYTIKLKTGNAFCGMNEITKTVCVNPIPTVSFALDKISGCTPLVVSTTTTTNTPTCGDYKYIWTVDYARTAGCVPVTGNHSYTGGTNSSSSQPLFQFNDPGTYTLGLVIVSPGGTCSTQVVKKTVTVKSKPVVKLNGISASLCQNQSIKPGSDIACDIGAATTYSWAFPGGTPASSASADPGTVFYNTPGSYDVSLSVTNECGTTTITTPIIINATPDVTVPSNISACVGENIGPLTFSSIPAGATFSWVNDNSSIGLAKSGTQNPIAVFSAKNSSASPVNANITVTAKIGNCSNSEAFNIRVMQRPENPMVQNVSYCQDDIAVPLTAGITSGNSLLWYTTETGGTGNAVAPTPVTNVAAITTYFVSQKSSSGTCEGLRVPITVTVNPKPQIASASSVNPANCASATGSITLTGLSATKLYQVNYTKDGINTAVNISSNGSGVLVISNLLSGTYNNIFVQLAGCPSNSVGPYTLSDPNPPATPVATSNGPLCSGTALSLLANTTETGSVSFKWSGPDNFSSTDQNPVITSVRSASSGRYFVTVTRNSCTSLPAYVDVIVNPLPLAPLVSPISYCIGGVSLPLTASGASLNWYTSPAGGSGTTTAPVPLTSAGGITNYYVSQTDDKGCESGRARLEVAINPNAIAEFNPPVLIYCPPFKITPASIGLREYPSNNSQYSWYINGSFAGSGADFPGYTIPDANDSVMITLKTASLFGCKADSMSRKFFTYKLPKPSFTLANNEGCGPLSVQITNTTEDISLYNYQWDFGNGQTSTAVQPGNIVFLTNPNFDDTVYRVKLKMLSVCDTIVVEKMVHIKSKPKALFTPDITQGCSPMKVVFKNTSKGIGNTYYWDFGDGYTEVSNTPGNVQHTFYSGMVDTFYVRLIAINHCGSDTIKYAITVAPNTIKLNFAMNGPDHFGCAPHTVPFINNSSGASSFQWNFGDGNFLSTSKNIDTVYHTYLTSGNYTVSLRAQNSCADTTTTDYITVFPKPVAAFAGDRYTVCKGDSIRFSNQSASATSYLWQFGDGTTSVLENPIHTYSTAGTYTVVLKAFRINASGSICTDSAVKQIQVLASLPGSFTMSESVSTCAPLTVKFINQNQPSATVNWDFGDGATASGDSVTHTYNFSGVYNVTLTTTAPGGCVYLTTKKVSVNGPSGTLLYSGGYNCSPNPVRLEAIATNSDTFAWDFGDGVKLVTTQPVVYHAYTKPGNYLPVLILRNAAGCEYPIRGTDTIRVDRIDAGFTFVQKNNCGSTDVAFSDTSYVFSGKSLVKWNFGDGNSSTGNKVNHTYTSSGKYLVEMIVLGNSGCSDTVRRQINFHVNNKPVVHIAADASACTNQSISFSGIIQSSDSLNILQWNISNGAAAVGANLKYVFTTPGTYKLQLIVGTVNGCYDTAYHTIEIKPSPNVKASADITLCKGNSAQLNVSGAQQYQWSPLQGLSCTTCNAPVVTPEISTPYVVTGFNNVGCPGYDTVNITVIQPLQLNTSGNDSICIGGAANLVVSGAASYNWSPSVGLSSTTISNPVANPQRTTTYRVIGYDGHNCFTDTAFIVVAVGQYPTINLGPDQTLSTGTVLPLTTSVINGPIKKWLWTPSTNLDCNDCPLPYATLKKDITYAVQVTNSYGCSASDTINIKVFCKNAQVFIPNAFSPDGDGINDVLMVRGTGIVTVKSFRIFNRWGELVFERNNFVPNEAGFGWDGRIRGKTGPPEVYVYTAEVLCENGVSFTYKGNSTILK